MRKLKLQVQMTIDGFIGGPNGEMDWMTWNWDDELKDYTTKITTPITTIVLGRKVAEGFVQHWSGVAADPNNPEVEAGKKFTETPKVVFSRTLSQSPWPNTEIAKGDLRTAINNLKSAGTGDIMAYGGASFVSSLIKEQLIDEFHLFINPVAIGKGLPIFSDLKSYDNLKLSASKAYPCGIVVMKYER